MLFKVKESTENTWVGLCFGKHNYQCFSTLLTYITLYNLRNQLCTHKKEINQTKPIVFLQEYVTFLFYSFTDANMIVRSL